MSWDPAEIDRWLRRYAWVPIKGGKTVKFTPNAGQLRMLHEHPAIRGECGHFPVIKGRQAGFTTFWLLVEAALMDICPGISVLTLTPNEKPVGMQVIAKWRRLIQLATKQGAKAFLDPFPNSRDEMELKNGSRLTWAHIGGTESVADVVGRAGTFDFVLATEFAFPHEADLARIAMESLEPALERAEAPVVYDSTPGESGDGETGEPYVEIIKKVLAGTEDGAVCQVGWWEVSHPHHRKRLPSTPEEYGQTLTTEEKALIYKHQITLEQIEWRRRKIAKKGRRAFLKAYPERLEHVFDQKRPNRLFDQALIEEIQERRDLGEWPEPLHIDALAGLGLDVRPMEAVAPGEGSVLVFEPPKSPPQKDTAPAPRAFPERPRGRVVELDAYLHRRNQGRDDRATRRAQKAVADRGRWRHNAGCDSSDGYTDSDWQAFALLDGDGALCALVTVRVHPLLYAAIVQALLTWYGSTCRFEKQHAEKIAEYVSVALSDDHFALAGDVPKGALEILKTAYQGPMVVEQTSRGQSRGRIVDAAMGMLTGGHERVVKHQSILDQMGDLERGDGGKIAARKSRKGGRKAYDDIFMALGLAGVEQEQWLSWAPREDARVPRRAPRRGRKARHGYFR